MKLEKIRSKKQKYLNDLWLIDRETNTFVLKIYDLDNQEEISDKIIKFFNEGGDNNETNLG